jgi:hypothetical protein
MGGKGTFKAVQSYSKLEGRGRIALRWGIGFF